MTLICRVTVELSSPKLLGQCSGRLRLLLLEHEQEQIVGSFQRVVAASLIGLQSPYQKGDLTLQSENGRCFMGVGHNSSLTGQCCRT
ncbi:hypothetical protein BH688_12020 [Kushneria phosphatilytica]|nr:hypothetical protein BH688_12020 [Kushneria phosphatilytica]